MKIRVLCRDVLSTDKHTAVSEGAIYLSSDTMQTGYSLNSKTLVTCYQWTRHQIPEDFHLNLAMKHVSGSHARIPVLGVTTYTPGGDGNVQRRNIRRVRRKRPF